MNAPCHVGPIVIGPGHDLVIIAGPCVLEDDAVQAAVAERIGSVCRELKLPWIFKGSFDKANRTSLDSPRGPGLDQGLRALATIRDLFNVPVTTDVHEPEQAAAVAEVADLLQVPAFLCRQTNLLAACGRTGKPINIKKGQFLSPADMTHAAEKALDAGAGGIMLTERGTFFGYHRLVNDFVGLGDMAELGWPVCFDVTHSTQLPGAGDATAGHPVQTAGRPERAGLLARAATAAGVDAIFIETHPTPPAARSDATTVQSLDAAEQIIREAHAIRCGLRNVEVGTS
ncbi:MAG: 3-deoxy-8-phosphooctulonate synthase [Phycisphaerales bacterium]|jgi:2-dehydro-3-deoxyphosphooctonate aldolase (KDO 8-P synthase)|nr:3-deoxy-8-phosphooctulonate synthase [Phycisphaerales bacterium]MDP6890613.1 3-deoxy-8-phosphooctulonate synthase [Phycisphaerales bacterium]